VLIHGWTGAIVMKWVRALLVLVMGGGVALTTKHANAEWYLPRFADAEPCCGKWSGFYIGVHAGGAWALVDWGNVSGWTVERVNNDSNGFIGGGQIGYNWQLNHFVLGVEGTLSGTDLQGNVLSGVDSAVTYRTDVHSLATVTGRLGIAAYRSLVYAKGGWAIGQSEVSGRNTATADAFSFDKTRNGWTVGTGVEFALNGISVGLEYSYVDLSSEGFFGTTSLSLPIAVKDVDTRMHLLTARINFY
jgi:outer membrane immunogenic protein